MTIFQAYNQTKKDLETAGIEDVVFEAKQIIKHITGYSSSQILTNYNNQLTEFQQNNLTALVKQRELRYPLQYIFGSWGFYGNTFKVGPGVLIPRADTETLIDKSLAFLKTKSNPKVLDLCAGSGCIGITLAKEIPSADVTMVEKYEEAMRYAVDNIKGNGVSNARILKGDIFEAFKADEQYDLIVSNPPYIPESETDLMSPETKYEPETSFFAAEKGLEFYHAITEKYKESLKPDGMMAFEVGIHEANGVKDLMQKAGFINIGTSCDLNGIERVVFGTSKNIELNHNK